MAVTYGLEVLPENDPYIEVSEAVNSISTAVVPGAFLVDSIPVLKYVPEWMPGAGFKKKAKEWKVVIRKMLEIPFAAAKSRVVSLADVLGIDFGAFGAYSCVGQRELYPIVSHRFLC